METPLEPLETKLKRFIEDWKYADALFVDGNAPEKDIAVKHLASYNLAQFIATHPEMVKGSSPDLPLVDTLLSLPTLIRDAQERFDKIDQEYQEAIAVASINSLGEAIFKGKDETLHMACNDIERKLAIDIACAQNPSTRNIGANRADALRELQCTKARFEAAKLMVQLITRK